MQTKDIAQLLVSGIAPFVAAGGALALAAFQRRERIACVITYGMDEGLHGPQYEASFLTVHNLTNQNVAISRLRYLGGFPRRPSTRGTALDYLDPFDVRFPYLIAPGEIRRFQLDEGQALALATGLSKRAAAFARVFRRDRILLETTTTTGFRKRIGAEAVLNWRDRAPWALNA